MRIEPFEPPSNPRQLNVGDDLNFYIFPKLIDNLFDNKSRDYFLGIGTILTKKRFKRISKHADSINIFSSGAWDENYPEINEKCNFLGVRGYRTARKLGLLDNQAIGDGAYLLSTIDYPKNECKGKIGFIPHQSSERYIDWEKVCENAGLFFISPKQPVDDFLIQLQECQLVVAEAMHGAIIADVLRIPWIPVSFAPDFNTEKWLDYSEFMDLSIDIKPLSFMSEYKIKTSKTIESIFRKYSAKLFNLSNKRKRLPIVINVATKKDLEKLSAQLIKARNGKSYLSSDQKFTVVVENQKKIISDFAKTVRDI